MDEEGLVCITAARSPQGGVLYDGVLYPDELLRDLGAGLYQLATALEMPADGNTAHPGTFTPVVSVSQIEWTASWASYDRARRRINWDELWQRGGTTANLAKNMILALVLVTSLFSAWAGFRTSGSAAELANQVGDTRGALNRTIELLQEQRAVLVVASPTPSKVPLPSQKP
jgi:hypothetical protein